MMYNLQFLTALKNDIKSNFQKSFQFYNYCISKLFELDREGIYF